MPPLVRFVAHDLLLVNTAAATTPTNNNNNNNLHIWSSPDNVETKGKSAWSPAKSSLLYRVPGWGAPYFSVNECGNMVVHPHGTSTLWNQNIDLLAALRQSMDPKSGAGARLPLIMRFPDILKHRLDSLQSAFDLAISSHNYSSRYQGVYPVKCNQDRHVVESLVEFGKCHRFGLEAGSKPELLLSMACLCSKGSRDAFLVCNGYKDVEYVSLAMRARQLGINCIIVLEQARELELVMEVSERLGIEPWLGLRAKLHAKHAGHFGETSGEHGKFGLSPTEILKVVDQLRGKGMLGRLRMLHFHIGSQIPSLSILRDGVSEAAQIYCELSLAGARMGVLDIGGGLGIDYDGTRSATSADASVGYTMMEFASEVVSTVHRVCVAKSVSEPILCSESGRALVSHHSVLLFNVFSASNSTTNSFQPDIESQGLPNDLATACHNLRDSLEHPARLKHKSAELFKNGVISLAQLAFVNELCDSVSSSSIDQTSVYHINLSIFKSIPDTWAIGQLFPILPLHRLHEKPTVKANLADLTCDSDGKVASFITTDEDGRRRPYLPVHELEDGQPYYMGMFLGGAYQEALGSLHNLFGNLDVIHVRSSGGSGFTISYAIPGQTSAEVLQGMQYDPWAMLGTLRKCLHFRANRGEGNGDDEKEEEGEDDQDGLESAFYSLALSFASPTYLRSADFVIPTVPLPPSTPKPSINPLCNKHFLVPNFN